MIHTNLPVTFCLYAMTRTLYLCNNNSLQARDPRGPSYRKSFIAAPVARSGVGVGTGRWTIFFQWSKTPRWSNYERCLFAGFLKLFGAAFLFLIVIMSGYTSSYRSYDSRKLANGSLKVNEDNRVANGMCDNDCYIVRVDWNYTLEVSGGWDSVLYKVYLYCVYWLI